MPTERFHATVLNLHQPAGNLQGLLDHAEWEAREILFAYDRIPRALQGWEDVARVHLPMSGTLLETLASPEFQARVYGIVKCGDLLWRLRHPAIEILGTGFYHPVLPLTPDRDREEHVMRWLGLARHLFDRPLFQGFWPPEMGFSMELIPLLRRAGYRYVLVDSEHIEPVNGMRWEEIRYRPHVARHAGEEIIVVVRDRELSDAQESGMAFGWFKHEVYERTKGCDFPPLVTTCSDGENGGWFRNTNDQANFWGVFYRPMLEAVRANDAGFRPIFISEYLDRYGAHGEVRVREGAWNTGWHHGRGFVQWTGSLAQQDALRRVEEVSRIHHETANALRSSACAPEVDRCLGEAHWRLLRAETSCNFYWGADWVTRAHTDLTDALRWLDRARSAVHA